MNDNKTRSKKEQTQTRANVSTPEPKAKAIKLGIDVHLDRYVVVRITDGGTPQPPQRFEPVEFMLWVAKQIMLAEKVFTCYEAGPFGYSLHRKLEKMGVTNYVVRPRDWDEYGKKVKTDKRDAKELALHLDRYVNGNLEAFCVVRVPTPEQEQERSISRQRESFQRERQRLAAQGRSYALLRGARRAARRSGQTDQRNSGAGSGRLEPLQKPAPGGQLHRLMSQRGQLQRPPLSGLDQQTRQPPPAARIGRVPVAVVRVSARVSGCQKVAA